MSTRLQTQAKVTSPSLTPVRSGLLQRESAWNDTPGLTDELAEPREGRLVSQPPLVQPELTVGRPNDRYEQEADRVADLVMRMPEPRLQRQIEPEEQEEEEALQVKPLVSQITPLVQRQVKPEEEEEEEPVQAKQIEDMPVQRQEEGPEEEEEEPIQAKRIEGTQIQRQEEAPEEEEEPVQAKAADSLLVQRQEEAPEEEEEEKAIQTERGGGQTPQSRDHRVQRTPAGAGR